MGSWLLIFVGCATTDVTLPVEHLGGDYRFVTMEATDRCLDGALELLFMPEGPESPHAFEYLIPVPSLADLPQSYPIDLREPFVGMDVTVSSVTQGRLHIEGSMESVALGNPYGDCVSHMEVAADLQPVAETQLEGTAIIGLSGLDGAEGLCPVLQSDPCEVTLSLFGDQVP